MNSHMRFLRGFGNTVEDVEKPKEEIKEEPKAQAPKQSPPKPSMPLPVDTKESKAVEPTANATSTSEPVAPKVESKQATNINFEAPKTEEGK